MDPKRITLFAGHYGSGKTNIAVNYAFYLRGKGLDVCVADLDIVNPYFRTKDSEAELKAAGIPLISSAFANSNVDLPALPQELYSLVERKDKYAVMDIGGDDRGALALGRYTPYILEEQNYEMVFVANFYRPLTQTPEDALEIMREIEQACGIRFTAIANNSNIGWDTTAEDVMKTVEYANRLSELCGVNVIMTCAENNVAEKLKPKLKNVFGLTLQKKYFDITRQ